MERVILTIHGPNFTEVGDTELFRLPAVGDPIETKYGTAVVTESEQLPLGETYDGRVACRLP
jgi:hypothetical protein